MKLWRVCNQLFVTITPKSTLPGVVVVPIEFTSIGQVDLFKKMLE